MKTAPREMLLREAVKALQGLEDVISDWLKAKAITARQFGTIYRDLRRISRDRRTGRHTPSQWETLKAFYDFTCLCCGQREPDITLTKDHVDPAGTNDITNIQPLCVGCNHTKDGAHIDYRGTDTAVQAIRRAMNLPTR